jgi:hypothetical protein
MARPRKITPVEPKIGEALVIAEKEMVEAIAEVPVTVPAEVFERGYVGNIEITPDEYPKNVEAPSPYPKVIKTWFYNGFAMERLQYEDGKTIDRKIGSTN